MTSNIITGPAYRIETERLVLRCWNPTDAPRLNAAIRESWDHLRPWMPWAQGELPTVNDTLELLRYWRGEFDLGTDFFYGIFDSEETAVWGATGLHIRRGPDAREIGYWVHVDVIGQGYATETAAALTKVAFEVDEVCRVEIHCLTSNVRSAAVPRKLGFTHEATLRQRLPTQEGYGDEMIWTLLEDEYAGSPVAKVELSAYDALERRLI